MAIIKFKDVGQGDSILISYEDLDGIKIGIIDCHRYSGTNPILEELSAIDEEFIIEFIIISHGHKDHYSGIVELLTHCKRNKIVIHNLVSTIHPSQFQFFEITSSYNEQKSIAKLVQKINHLYSVDKIILDIFPAYNKVIKFPIENYIFECLYPRQSDYNVLGYKLEKYIKGKIKTKPDLNFISTIFKLSNNSIYALFTSDCTTESLDYIQRKDIDLKQNELNLTQVPHHGSIKNHNLVFWDNRNKIKDCPSVFSSGESRHSIPDSEVVEDFHNLEYKIYSTNYVHGIKTFVEGVNIEENFSYALDSFSELVEEYSTKGKDRFRGDKVFKILDSEMSYVPQLN